MDRALLIALAGTALVLVVGVVVAAFAAAGRRRLHAEINACRGDVDALRDRLEEVSRQVDRGTRPTEEDAAVDRPGNGFVITTMRDGTSGHTPPMPQDGPSPGLSARAFASVALGESLVRVVSFGHGVRRAMTPENRNRIRFEMQREVKRARRQRRRDLKEAKRHLRTGQRTELTEDAA
jgi:hypothetical protein